MGVVQRFERRLEGLVEGTFAKVFGGVVQPVEVAAALQREAGDRKVLVGPDRVLVPNEFVVELGDSDAERLKAYEAPLRRELAAMVTEHAAEQGWSFVGPVDVRLEAVPDLGTGVFRVSSSVVAAPEPARPVAPAAPATRASAPAVPVGPVGPAGSAAHRAPAPTAPPSLLIVDRLTEGRASEREVPLRAGVTRVGRGAECDVRLTDTGVSRLHAEVHVEPGPDGLQLSIVDLRSTNGTTVNGRRVQSGPLRDGDRIGVGSTGIVVRVPGGR